LQSIAQFHPLSTELMTVLCTWRRENLCSVSGGAENYLFCTMTTAALEHIQTPKHWASRAFSLAIKQHEHEAEQSSAISAEIRNA